MAAAPKPYDPHGGVQQTPKPGIDISQNPKSTFVEVIAKATVADADAYAKQIAKNNRMKQTAYEKMVADGTKGSA